MDAFSFMPFAEDAEAIMLKNEILKAKEDAIKAADHQDKHYIQSWHVSARDLNEKRLKEIHQLYAKYHRYLINGRDLNPEKIDPVLLPIASCKDDPFLSDIFRLCRHTWSMPFSGGYGRRLKFVVMDQHHQAVIGILGMQSPPIDLACRDLLFGYTKEDKINRVNATMDIYTAGSLPPYSDLLGGKLVAGLAACNEVRQVYQDRYVGRETVMRKTIVNYPLVAMTTTSAFGRSSMYNRLKYHDRLLAKSIGYTRGFGTFHLDHLYPKIMAYLRRMEIGKTTSGYGTGPKVKWQNMAAVINHLGLPIECMWHGVRREVYLYALIQNIEGFMRHGEEPVFYDMSAKQYIAFWKTRWLEKRLVWMDQKGHPWKHFNAEDYFLNGKRNDHD